jgi:hypothetical protein
MGANNDLLGGSHRDQVSRLEFLQDPAKGRIASGALL